MTNIVFFDRFDPWASYQSCMQYVNDHEYCMTAVKLLAETRAARRFDYGDRVRFHVLLPDRRHNYVLAADEERRYIVIFIDGGPYTAVLVYERRGGGFALKTVDWIISELKALHNPHPASFFRD